MGVYLNSKTAYTLFENETEKPYFVDKSKILRDIIPLVQAGNNHICITRPRRFGKTVMANMIASFFSKACDSKELFRNLQIAKTKGYEKFQNQYDVIHISFNDIAVRCTSYRQYIERISRRLVRDLKRQYPNVEFDGEEDVVDVLTDIYAEDDTARFIFVLMNGILFFIRSL